MRTNRVFLVFSACAAMVFASCASAPPVAEKPAAAPVEKPAAKAAEKPAEAPAEKPAPPAVSGDYLGESIKLVGFRAFSWQGDLYTVPFYTAEIVTPPSPDTKNEGLVRPTQGKVPDSSEAEFWTPYIASSRPAVKDELKPGLMVFAMGDAQPRSRETLATTTNWALFRVKDVSNLFKGTVTLEYHDTYWDTWKEREYHVNNVRVVVGEFSTELAK